MDLDSRVQQRRAEHRSAGTNLTRGSSSGEERREAKHRHKRVRVHNPIPSFIVYLNRD
jgi:hypothetical protein